ncbi:hypothetical protein PENTCL1PPCAC_4367, partial [Pristionchus entomophagus]
LRMWSTYEKEEDSESEKKKDCAPPELLPFNQVESCDHCVEVIREAERVRNVNGLREAYTSVNEYCMREKPSLLQVSSSEMLQIIMNGLSHQDIVCRGECSRILEDFIRRFPGIMDTPVIVSDCVVNARANNEDIAESAIFTLGLIADRSEVLRDRILVAGRPVLLHSMTTRASRSPSASMEMAILSFASAIVNDDYRNPDTAILCRLHDMVEKLQDSRYETISNDAKMLFQKISCLLLYNSMQYDLARDIVGRVL